MKKNVLITISLLLIIIKAQETDTCKSLTTEENCNKDENCEWTAGKCKGDSGTTCSSVKSSSACPTTTYPASTPTQCTFNAESSGGTCSIKEGVTGTPDCSSKNTKDGCTGETDCKWTPTTPASCTGHKNCEDVQNPIQTTCEETTFTDTVKCTWDATAGSCASKTKTDKEGEEEEEEEEKSDGGKTDGGKTEGSGSGSGNGSGSGSGSGTGTGTGTGNTSGSGSDSAFGLKFSGLIYLLLALF